MGSEHTPGPVCRRCHCAREDFTIALCSLHGAAPELLEALIAIEAGFRDGSIKFTKQRKSDADPYHPANTLMCAAIARATGEGR